MLFLQIPVGEMANFSYLVGCPQTRIGAVIDCGFEAEKIYKIANNEKIQIKHIFLTHVHYDHSRAAEKLAELTGATVWMNPISKHKQGQNLTRGMWVIPPVTKDIIPGKKLTVGMLKCQVIASPGHQGDHLLFEIGNYLFTGDTLFVGGVGRTDLPDSDPQDLKETLEKIKHMRNELLVCPGHDYGEVPLRNLGEEKLKNPYLMD